MRISDWSSDVCSSDLRGALEFVRSGSVLALLLAEGCDRELHRARPCLVERRLVARTRPIFVGQAPRIAERVDFPFALGDAGLPLGLVGLRPFALRRCGRVLVDGIGIGVAPDAARLTLYPPLEPPPAFRTLHDQLAIRPIGRVSG